MLHPAPTVRTSRDSVAWGLLISLAVLAVFFGIAASLGSPILTLLIASPVAALLLAFRPTAIVWGVLAGGLVVTGISDLYMPVLHQARWGVMLGAILLGSIALASHVVRPPSMGDRLHSPSSASSALLPWLIAFVALSLVSALANEGASLNAAVGLKGYFQVAGLLLAFALLPMAGSTSNRMMRLVPWLGLLQLPFALHQTLFLVPKRMGTADAAHNIVAQDIVVGTFSGSMSGGGAGPSMAILLGIALTIVAANWKCRRIDASKALLVSLALVAPLALGEHKLGMIFILVVPLVVFGRNWLRNPVKTVGISVLSLSAAVLLFLSFTMLPRTDGARNLSPTEYFERSVDYNFGFRGYGSLYLNRSTVYPFWWQNHQTYGGLAATLLGYGPGATNESLRSLADHSFATVHYPWVGIGLTGLSALLWEVGVLGTAAFVGLLFKGVLLARRLASEVSPSAPSWAYLKAAEAGIIMAGLSLVHSRTLVFEIGAQTLLMLLLGYLWQASTQPHSLGTGND